MSPEETAEKKIRRYIRPSTLSHILVWAALALTLALLLGGLLYYLRGKRMEPRKFDALASEKESLCYVDVVGVSDWVYCYRCDNLRVRYYAAEDADGRYCFVTIPDKEYRNMRAQADYWNAESGPAPEPYRVTGWAVPIPDAGETRRSLMHAVGASSTAEFREYFGELYLDATGSRRDNQDLFFVGALVCGLFFLFTAPSFFLRRAKMKKCLRELEKNGELAAAEEDLRASRATGKCVIGSRFFFARGEGFAVAYTGVSSCRAAANGVELKTDRVGSLRLRSISREALEKLMAALPLDDRKTAVIWEKSR